MSTLTLFQAFTGADALKVTHPTHTHTYFVTVAFAQKEIMRGGVVTGKKREMKEMKKQRTGGDEKRGNETN